MVEVSGDDANQSGNEIDSSSGSLESAADSGPEPATGDCLTCSDTKEVAINSAHIKFWKKVGASCSITKGCLWSEAQLKGIGDSHQAVWENDCDIIKTEQELAVKEDHHSFEINDIQDQTTALNQRINALENPPHELEAGVQGRKKTPVQSLKQYPCILLPTVQKGHNRSHGQLAGIAFG